jgi:hypothetical protein
MEKAKTALEDARHEHDKRAAAVNKIWLRYAAGRAKRKSAGGRLRSGSKRLCGKPANSRAWTNAILIKILPRQT